MPDLINFDNWKYKTGIVNINECMNLYYGLGITCSAYESEKIFLEKCKDNIPTD